MTGLAWIAAIVAATVAIANWWSRWTLDRRLERVTKPAVTLALIVAAAAIDAEPAGATWWFVVGLVLCLAGDVALLPDVDRFVVGLGSFLVGHVLFAVGAVVIGISWPWAAAAAAVAVVVGALVGPRIIRGSGELAPAVSAYFAVIMVMAVLMVGTARVAGVLGAAAFVVSDSILGWDRFVGKVRRASVLIMVTYHLALCGLVLTLL